MKLDKRRPFWIIGVLPYFFIILYFSFAVFTIVRLKLQAVFNYFAADSFYYLTVAKNSQRLWNSADGITHTNGFHPLWQNLLNLVSWIFSPTKSNLIWITFGFSFFFVLVGFLLMSHVSKKISSSSFSWIFMFPGIVYLCSYQSTTVEYGVTNIYQPLSFLNGMESATTIFLFGLLFLFLSRFSDFQVNQYFGLGGLISLIVMSRLDDVFLLAGFAVYILFVESQQKFRKFILLVFPSVSALTILFLYHLVTNQTFIPVSGKIKGTDTGEFSSNYVTVLNLLHPGKLLEAVNTRAYGLFIPLFLAIFYLVMFGLIRNTQHSTLNTFSSLKIYFIPLSTYVIFKSIYIFYKFYLIETGYWYYVGPVICVNFLAVVIIGKLFDQTHIQRFFLIFVIALIQIFNLSFTFHKLQTDNSSYTVFSNRQTLESKLIELFGGDVKFIDGTDGIYSYIFDKPSQSARGFTTNRDGFKAFQAGGYDGYYSYLLKNGYNVLVGLNTYTHPVPDSILVRTVFIDANTGTVFSKLEQKTP